MTLTPLAHEILDRGLDDWIQLSELVWVVQESDPTSPEDQIRDLAISVIEDLLNLGLVEVGNLTHDGFVSWNLPVAETICRIRDEWIALGRSLNLGDVCWLNNTPAGDARAR